MKKKIFVILICSAMVVSLAGCGSGETTANKETDSGMNDVAVETDTDNEITSLTLNDLHDYLDMDSSIYVIQGTNLNSALSFSYDSSVIKSISIDTSDVDTNATPGDVIGTIYDASYVIVVDVNELCKKENKINGMAGDTAQVAGILSVIVVTREQADEMIEYGASPEHIIGY